MSVTTAILCWWAAFAGTHVLLSSRALRPQLVARLGDRGFAGLYSLVAFATFVPLVVVYMRNRHAGAPVELLAALPAARPLAIVSAAAGFALIAAAFAQPSPTGMDPRAKPRAYGVSRITRHPLFMGLALWGLAHVLVNRTAADLAFFGGFALFSVIGAMHQDARKRIEQATRLGGYLAETSLVPFAAIVRGTNRLVLAELPWLAFAIGAATAVGLYRLHPVLFY